MTEPPITILWQKYFHPAGLAPNEPFRRMHQQTAKRVAFTALTSGQRAAQLISVVRTDPAAGASTIAGGWLIADPSGTVTAHPGQYVGEGGPWDLADAIMPGSADAVRYPSLNGYYRAHPEAYRESVKGHAAALLRLGIPHSEAVIAENVYAQLRVHADPTFLSLLSAGVGDRATQLVLHDWLAEHDFPHVDELRSKRWNQGKWTPNQLLDLLSKPFASKRRSFSGRAVSA